MMESVNLTLLKLDYSADFEPLRVYYDADQSFISSSCYSQCLVYHKLWDWTNFNQLNLNFDLHIICIRA